MSSAMSSILHFLASTPIDVAGILIRIVLVAVMIGFVMDMFRHQPPSRTILPHIDRRQPPRRGR